MKNKLPFLLFFLLSIQLFAQTDGMSYQAVILSPSPQELPGVDVARNILPNAELKVRFSIFDAQEALEYQEIHSTKTDAYGMINLIIGQGSPENGVFTEMDWNGTKKVLEVEINLNGTFNRISKQNLYYTPYALHRDVTATGDLNVDGTSNLNSSLTVNNQAPTVLSGSLEVTDGSATTLSGTLNVDGETSLENSLTVNNQSATLLTGALTVGGATSLENELRVKQEGYFEKNIRVTDTVFTDVLQSNSLNVTANVPDGEFVTTFENTNEDKGDGLLIKLGRARANDGLPDYQVDVTDAATTEKYRRLLSNEINNGEKVVILRDLAAEIAKNDVQFLLNTTLGIGNMLIKGLNTAIDLPWTSRKLMVALNGCDPYVLADGSFVQPNSDGEYEPAGPCHEEPNDYWDDLNSQWVADGDVPGPGEGFTFFPEIPEIPPFSFTIPSIPGVFPESEEGRTITIEPYDFTDPSFWEIPSLELKDFVSNPLNDSNEFITFADKNGIRMGAIKAQSVEDWVFKYLDAQFMYKLRDAAKSTFDKKHAKWHMKSLITSAIKSYKDIGVVYSSGNGDYAEWLERIDASENISTGDIVAVIGGKITKDLTNAEQVMAVSHQPIVLGNIPAEGKNYLGNNIAFMGQIPVKIMGPVNTGDYIVGKGAIKGFGVAISPDAMTLEDFKHAVGRSWDSNPNNGPKMVNTVVGVHNGDYIKILQKYEAKFNETNARLQNVEAKIDNLTQIITTYN